MAKQEKSAAIASPDELSEYIHVTTPSVWLVLIAVLILVAGALFWAGCSGVLLQPTAESNIAHAKIVKSFFMCGYLRLKKGTIPCVYGLRCGLPFMYDSLSVRFWFTKTQITLLS